MNDQAVVDVAIIGGGFSGLLAARKLKKSGLSVKVLEARGRVGGRNWDPQFPDGRTVVLGSQWVSPHQTRMIELGKEFDLTLHEPSALNGKALFDTGTFIGFIKVNPELEYDEELVEVVKKFDAMAETVPLDKPWEAPKAKEWDSQTLYTWLLNEAGEELVEVMTPPIMDFMSHPQDVSLLHALFYTKANGGFASFFTELTSHNHDSHVFVEGAQRINDGVAAELGDIVQLNSPVHEVHQDDAGVELKGLDFSLKARKVIVAMPPALCGALHYDPPLSSTRSMLVQRAHMGTREFKVDIMYKSPFWLKEGLSGYVDFGRAAFMDLSPPHGRWGVLTGLVKNYGDGKELIEVSPKERKASILLSLEEAFGDDHKKNFLSYHEHDWAADEYSRGCVTVMSTMAWSNYGVALRRPEGHIHWAGTETATEYPGQMEGAIRAGERAADEVIQLLKA